MTLIGLLATLLVLCIVIWAARALLTAFGIGDPIATVIYVIIVLFALFIILNALGLGAGLLGGPILRTR